MANAMRAAARASAEDKMRRMNVKSTTADFDNNVMYGAPEADSTPGVAPVGYADQYRDGDRVTGSIDGKRGKLVLTDLDMPAGARSRAREPTSIS